MIKSILVIFIILFLPLSLTADEINNKHDNNGNPLVLGVLPFRSPVALLKRFSPLRDYLQQELGKPVILETASTFDEFVSRTNSGRYDFVLTAPHFTLLALESGKYEIKATYLKPLTAAVSVRQDSHIRRLQQLSGKKIATPPEAAIITKAGKNHIQKQPLEKEPQFISYQSHNASIDAVMIGEVDASIASINPTRQFIKKGGELRIISVTPPLPGMGLLVLGKLPEALKKQYELALINMHKKENGKVALTKMGYPGYRKATKEEFESTRDFLKK